MPIAANWQFAAPIKPAEIRRWRWPWRWEPKGEKMDFVVEKATELGVASILPFTSSFTVPKLDAKKIANRTERWQKIALSAAKQCGRSQVPEILPLCEFRHMVEGAGASQLKLLFWEKGDGAIVTPDS